MSVIASNIHILGNAFRLVVTSTSWRATKLEVEPWRFSFLAAGPKVKSIQNLENQSPSDGKIKLKLYMALAWSGLSPGGRPHGTDLTRPKVTGSVN